MSQKIPMRQRVLQAADAVLQREGSVGPIELLTQIGFLESAHVKQWANGNPCFESLEPHIQCGEKKLNQTYRTFFQWVQENKLEPFEATYTMAACSGTQPLKISAGGDPKKEAFFKKHFRSPGLSEAKKKQIEKKQNKAPDLIAYHLTGKSSNCNECSIELRSGDLFLLEMQEALCLPCADMDHLEFLPSGNATLTRRARKHSPLSAIVLRFNRSRRRYDRQGVLVTADSIDAAEQQCASDADKREILRQQAAVRRQKEDQTLVAEMINLIIADYPGCPTEEAEAIARHTAVRGSGRVGRSAAGRDLDSHAIELAVSAWIRHQHTGYDQLLMQGIERQQARLEIRDRQLEVLKHWRG